MRATSNFSGALRCQICRRGFLLVQHPLSPWWCKTHFTLDSDAGVPEISTSWQASWWFLNILTKFLSSESDSLALAGLEKVVTHLNNVYLSQYFEMMILDLAVFYKWLQETFSSCENLQFSFLEGEHIEHIVNPSLNSLDFLTVPNINPTSALKQILLAKSAVVTHDH